MAFNKVNFKSREALRVAPSVASWEGAADKILASISLPGSHAAVIINVPSINALGES